MYLIAEEKLDEVYLLRLILERFGGSAPREVLIEAVGQFLDVNKTIGELQESGALRKAQSHAQLTQRGRRFVAALARAQEHSVRKTQDKPGVKVASELVADGLLLYQAHTTLFKLTERSLLESGLSLPQMLLLGTLYWDDRPLVPRRIRNTLVVEAQSLTGLIDRLEAQGLARRLSHPKDRRKIRIQITPKGRKKYEEAAVRMDQTMETYFQPLTGSERHQLRRALLKLRRGSYPLLGLSDEAAYPPVPVRGSGGRVVSGM